MMDWTCGSQALRILSALPIRISSIFPIFFGFPLADRRGI